MHDPGKTVLDLAVAIALGGDCLADVAVLRAQPELFGAVASDPTVSRLIEALGDDPAAVIAAIRAARAARPGQGLGAPLGRFRAPDPVVVDLDATLVGAHSEKEGATPNFKRGFGFHPMLAFVDHGAGGTGEPWRGCCARAGQRQRRRRPDRGARRRAGPAARADPLAGAGARRHRFGGAGVPLARAPTWGCSIRSGVYGPPTRPGRAGRAAPTGLAGALDADGQPTRGRPGRRADPLAAGDLHRWPPGMRIIARRERPHPGAQLRITDHDGWRITVFATNTRGGRLADLEVRHRLRARAEDRIRGLKDTGLSNLPLQEFAKNQIWLELVQLAAELLTWTQLLAWPDHPARTWEPKRLRLRLLAVAGRLITTGRRRILRLPQRWPWTDLITSGHQRLAALT